MDKQKYFIDLQSHEISKSEVDDNYGITIYATDTEVEQLRKTFDSLKSAEFTTLFRANVPILPYHHDKSNDEYDQSLTDAFQMVYDLGDEKSRKFVEDSGVLENKPIDSNYSSTNNHFHSDK